MKILSLYSQYIFSLLLYILNNKHLLIMNIRIHIFNTRNNSELHPPITNIIKFQIRVYYSGINIFNHLPYYIKHLFSKIKHFMPTLKQFLYSNSIYTTEDYLNYNK